MMSTEKLASLMGAKQYSKPIEDACIRWGIVTGEDKVRFIAQLAVESANFTRVEENMNYSAKRLVEVFKGRNGLTADIAVQLAKAGPRAIANHVYGGKWGFERLNNRIGSDDGWNFRGRGLIMLTGRDNYMQASLGCYGDYRLVEEPDLLLLPEVAADVSAWFWYSRKLNGIADVKEVTRRINSGLLHLSERVKKTRLGFDLLDLMLNP